jgi:hypothetical protein
VCVERRHSKKGTDAKNKTKKERHRRDKSFLSKRVYENKNKKCADIKTNTKNHKSKTKTNQTKPRKKKTKQVEAQKIKSTHIKNLYKTQARSKNSPQRTRGFWTRIPRASGWRA